MTVHGDASYDMQGAIETLCPGLVLQRAAMDAAAAAYAAGDNKDLTAPQLLTLLGPFPPFPTSLPRFEDSNPSPDGWAIDDPSGCYP